jgi:hypothetical protein
MNALQRFEQRLEQLISGAFARAFRSAVQPVEIAAALQRECDNNAQILSRQRRLVPNTFHVELSAADMTRLAPYDSALASELSQQLHQHAETHASDTEVRRATAFLDINGTRHPLHAGGLVVGRGTDADLRINDPGVSRKHAEFRQTDTAVEVHDLGSTNGMLVNGQRMTSSLLDDGSVVRIGNTDIVVRIQEFDV